MYWLINSTDSGKKPLNIWASSRENLIALHACSAWHDYTYAWHYLVNTLQDLTFPNMSC